MSVRRHFINHSYVLFISIAWLLFVTNACKKGIIIEEDTPDYVCTYKSGIYHGTFKVLGGCYACIPYTDTTYQGDIAVHINENDTIEIDGTLYRPALKFSCNVPQSPQYEWWRKGDEYFYGYQGKGDYIKINFINSDSLNITYDYFGSGGYSQYSFKGKRR
ncbi:MAG: hypothetical protein ABI761_06350 [Saprospiraceae bacterium]